jgi:hypothetical protein
VVNRIVDRIIEWITVDPTVSLLMIVATIVIVGTNLIGEGKGTDIRGWILRAGKALFQSAVFIGLLWSFRSVLNSNNNTFFSTHGSLSDLNRESAYTIWGRPHIQNELEVVHTAEVAVREEIPRPADSLLPRYRLIRREEQIPQNSILSFCGEAEMVLSEREKGYAYYSGFVLSADYRYVVINDSEYATRAEFAFPISANQTLFKDLSVRIDGTDIGGDLLFAEGMVTWQRKMRPQEQITVEIGYTTRGMDYFYYRVPDRRYINDFDFTLTIDRLPVSLLNYPDGVLTPTDIRPAPGGGSILTWKLDRAITTAGMGVALVRPEQPGEKVLRILVNSPVALTMLGALLALTTMILGLPLSLMDLILIAAAYCVEYLAMAGVSDFFFGFWGSLILGAALTLFLAFLLFRRLPSRLLKILLFILVAFYSVAYPLSGLIDQIAALNSFNAVLQVGMIVYLFGLLLYARVRTQPAPAGG